MSKKTLPLLLDELCTTNQIHALLKIYKQNNKDVIKLSGNKSDLIDNLLNALSLKIIPIEKVYILIQDSEEYGNQYIYLYKTQHPQFNNIYNNGDSIKSNILGTNNNITFPKMTLIPAKIEWADFRNPNRGVENSWLIKVYDKKEKEIKEKDFIDQNTGKRTVVYGNETFRIIYLMNWDGKGLLEYRISRTVYDSTKSIKGSLLKVQRKIKQGIDANHFLKVNLTKTVNKFLLSYTSHKEEYCLLSTQLKDTQEGTATIRIFDQDNGDLFSETSRKSAIEAYMNNQGSGTGIVVRFLAKGSKGELERDINVIIGRDDINQIIIQSQITPKEYKYVRRKIKEFS